MQNVFLLSVLVLLGMQNCTNEEKREKGNIIFWRYTDIINCGPVEVDVFIDNKYVGQINSDYLPYDSIPVCNAKNCLTIERETGLHTFNAECYCGVNRNKIGCWTGQIDVKHDSCSGIFLDIQKVMKCP